MKEKHTQYNEYQVEPMSASLGEITVTPVLRFDVSHNVWDVIIVFAYAPKEISMSGEDVDAQLLDLADTPLEMLARPAGPLVEVGGTLTRSANAHFRFQGRQVEPACLCVTYRNEELRFRIARH